MTEAAPLTRWEGRPLEHWRERWGIPALLAFQQVSSTNDVIRDEGAAGAPAGTTAIAEVQARGRGRLGRSWVAPEGRALLLSVLLRPAPGDSSAAGVLPLRVGLAIAAAVEQLCGQHAQLKWPNDVLLGGRKLAGVLCEAAGDCVVVGLGINVTQDLEDFPPELRTQATSLLIATGAAPARADLAGAVLRQLAPLFSAPHRQLAAEELERYSARDALAGRSVLVDDVPAGTAVGLTPLGALLVESRGERRPIHAGTVRSAP